MPPETDWIVPQWPVGPKVHALITTRNGGVSLPPLDTFNLGAQVGDDAEALLVAPGPSEQSRPVAEQRERPLVVREQRRAGHRELIR